MTKKVKRVKLIKLWTGLDNDGWLMLDGEFYPKLFSTRKEAVGYFDSSCAVQVKLCRVNQTHKRSK